MAPLLCRAIVISRFTLQPPFALNTLRPCNNCKALALIGCGLGNSQEVDWVSVIVVSVETTVIVLQARIKLPGMSGVRRLSL